MGKALNLKKIEMVARWCKEIGIDLEAFYIVGFPGETIKNMEETFEFAIHLNKMYDVFPMFNILSPLINTRIYRLCEERGYFVKKPSPEDLLVAQRGAGLIQTDDFAPSDIIRLFKKYRFFLFQTKVKKALKHPFLIKSYITKRISGTPLYKILVLRN